MMYIQNPITLDLPNSGTTTIPASPETPFWWNGTNAPRFAYLVIPPQKFPLMHIFHDYLCRKAKTKEG